MYRVSEVYDVIDSASPFNLQASWDNSGLNVGSMSGSVDCVYVSLELDNSVLESIEGNSLLVVHHPIIFAPLSNVTLDIYPCNLVSLLLKRNISLISVHTNFDLTHLNSHFARKIGFINTYKDGFALIEDFPSSLAVLDLADGIRSRLDLDIIRVSVGSSHANRVLISCGSGASLYKLAKDGDVVVTGDVKYHDAKAAVSMGISFVDVPHFVSESGFCEVMTRVLAEGGVESLAVRSADPFIYIKGKELG